MPGVEKENVNVSIDGNTLTVSGEKKSETKKEDEQYHYTERSYGSFQRVLDLPENANSDDVNASFKEGALTLKIGKSESKKQPDKKIEIQ